MYTRFLLSFTSMIARTIICVNSDLFATITRAIFRTVAQAVIPIQCDNSRYILYIIIRL